MKHALCLLALVVSAAVLPAQDKPPAPPAPSIEEMKKGANLLPFRDYSNADPMPLVKRYEGLRVTDVVDAMQAIGLQDTGSMDYSIRPLWRDTSEKLTHRIYGVAITFRYVPTNKPPAAQTSLEEFKKWHADWYKTLAPERFSRLIRPGTVVVIDAQDIASTGFIGSNNSLRWKSLGMAGVITNGGCRDTDEIILEKIPVYSKYISHGTRPGRIESASINQPVTVGGVLVRPWDMVVADGDGVVVVPREHAERVAEIAREIAGGDKSGRRKLYDKMGMKPDQTVK
jgi:4-hydroxy-4-methyl-2-oxoglutarate aldolase